MSEKILESIKKVLNIPSDYAAFDQDVLMHTNSVFSTLHQLGVGPDEGYMVEDVEATWDTFLGDDPRLNNIKTYIYLRVRMLFDPPATGFHTTAMREQIQELEWRINAHREDTEWTDPNVEEGVMDEFVLDGGVV